MLKNRTTEIRWALLFSLVTILWMALEKSMGYHGDNIAGYQKFTYFFIPVSFLVYFLALRDARKKRGGITSFKESLISGILISIFIAIFAPLTQWIIHNFITPDFLSNLSQYAVLEDGIDPEQADTFFTIPNYMKQTAIRAPITGTVISLLLSLIIRNDQ